MVFKHALCQKSPHAFQEHMQMGMCGVEEAEEEALFEELEEKMLAYILSDIDSGASD